MLILILFKIGITNFNISSIMLLLLSYCSVFKVQISNFQIKDLKIGGLERTRTSDLTLIRRAL